MSLDIDIEVVAGGFAALLGIIGGILLIMGYPTRNGSEIMGGWGSET